LNCAEQVARRRAHLDVRLRTDVLSQQAVSASPESNNDLDEALGLHLLDCPPATAARKLGVDERQVRSLRAGGVHCRLIIGCFGYDSKTVEGAQHRHESLAHLG